MVTKSIKRFVLVLIALFLVLPITVLVDAAVFLVERSTNQIIRLTEKEAEILQYLENSSSAVVSRDELLIEVWGYNSGVTTHTVETHIYRLRQKLEIDPTNAQCLVTAPGGYQLINS